jgi:hypothetical protein
MDRKTMLDIYKDEKEIFDNDFTIAKYYHKEMRL